LKTGFPFFIVLDSKLFCGTEEPKGSAVQTRKDACLAKKTARKPEVGAEGWRANPARLIYKCLYCIDLQTSAFFSLFENL